MGEIIRAVTESPLTAALIVCVALAGVIYRTLPMLVTRAVNQNVYVSAERDDAFRRRFEAHADRVHKMAGTIGAARAMVDRFAAMEDRVEEVIRDSADLARDVAELKGMSQAHSAQLERIENGLARIAERLIGPRG